MSISKFEIENFRVFKKLTSFDLSQVTILTGANSSGKSSMTNALLCSQNYFNNKREQSFLPTSFSQFGNPNKYVVNKDNNLIFKIHLDSKSYRYSSKNLNGPWIIEFSFSIKNQHLFLADFKILEKEQLLLHIKIVDNNNSGDWLGNAGYDVIIDIDYLISKKNGNFENYDEDEFLFSYSQDFLNKIEKNTEICQLIRSLEIDSLKSKSITSEMKNFLEDHFNLHTFIHDYDNILFNKFIEDIKKEHPYIDISIDDINQVQTNNLYFFWKECVVDQLLEKYSELEIAISNIENLKMDIPKIISKKDYSNLYIEYQNYENEKNQINIKLKELLYYGDEIEIDYIEVGFQSIYIKHFGNKINISDIGTGHSQLIYLLLKIQVSEGLIILKEPESNMHPALQSILADIIVNSGKQFLIETHSEYLIRRFQYLTATKEMRAEDSIIHYLFHPDSKHCKTTGEQLRTIHIQENGQLDKEFGTGFYDEADNMAFKLFSLNQNQQN